MFDKKLILEDGTVFEGYGFGSEKDYIGEINFDTSMFGYQKILAADKNKDKIINFTYPLIGNYGVCKEDYENLKLKASAIIVKELCEKTSNFQNNYSLNELLKKNNIVGISEIDTRSLTRKLREGKLRGAIVSSNRDTKEVLKEILGK